MSVIKRQDIQTPVIYEPFGISDIPNSVREDASVIYYSPPNRVTDSLMNIVLQKFFTSRGLNYTVKAFDREDALVRAYVKSRNEDPDSLSRGPLLAGIVFDNIGSKKLPSNIKYTLRFPSYQRTNYNGFTDRGNFRPSWLTENPYPILSFGGPRSKDNSYGGFPGALEYSVNIIFYFMKFPEETITIII
ncbi:unnamed protein product [Allacma fusca]|uniref:Uncharacterized protein n=2 Tax=Allacma fusca TaxID=39272 RepID=A0A8J2KN70_9HEXA|nr:unnamed protein product [Allacma fusca]